MALVQSFFISLWLESGFDGVQIVNNPGWAFRIVTVLTLASGTLLLMWLGEQIQEKGIGNGISLIIASGIISSGPSAFRTLVQLMSPGSGSAAQLQPLQLLLMIAFLIFVII